VINSEHCVLCFNCNVRVVALFTIAILFVSLRFCCDITESASTWIPRHQDEYCHTCFPLYKDSDALSLYSRTL